MSGQLRRAAVGYVWLGILAGCGRSGSWIDGEAPPTVLHFEDRLYSIEGLAGPEAVRFDPEQNVWFVSNFGEDLGTEDGRDSNGFITRALAETGVIDSYRFAVGTDRYPLHQPRGMAIAGDSLWVVDNDGVHGFSRTTGEQYTFIELGAFQPDFLNDVTVGPDGALYVTDTGRMAVYRIAGQEATEALHDDALGLPNGIVNAPMYGGLVLVPTEPGGDVMLWSPGSEPVPLIRNTPGRLDGVEPFDGRLLLASKADSTLRWADSTSAPALVRVPSEPADIGVDPDGRRVAVPYISENRVDVWRLP